MADTKKYFLDFGGLQALWNKMKSTFAAKSDVTYINGQISTINQNLAALQQDIDGVEQLALSYAPKEADTYSKAVEYAQSVPAGTVIVVGASEEVDGVTYDEGFYIVDGNKTLHYIATANGATAEEIAEIRDRIAALEAQIIKTAAIVDANGNSLGAFTISNNTMLVVYDDQVVADSQSVNALTHRAVAAKFKDLEGMISAVPKFKIEVVDALPDDGMSLSTIYLVKNTDESTHNLYTEYIYVQNKGWEKLGEQTIALDDYVTKTFLTETINAALSNYVKKDELTSTIAAVKTEILTDVENTYLKKADANFATEDSILESIQTGKIGNTIAITVEQIEALS